MNNVKSLIQKEEYISLAINKYILQTGKIPKKSDDTLDWKKLEVEDYLGVNFNKTNPVTLKDIVITFDEKNSAFIKGAIEKEADYKEEYNYLYNFYTNKVFRVNTIPPKNITKTELVKGSLVLYNSLQKEIATVLTKGETSIFLPSQTCNSAQYFYELKNEKLIYKYCKTAGNSIEVYQKAPVYLDNLDDLAYIKVGIGEKAYVKDGNSWYEYYYEGNSTWIPSGTGRTTAQVNDEITMEDRILSYIPDAKDLVLRSDGGCMLANGDIFCWGNNKYKKAGIETYGQLDTSLTPDYVNTPVMLKVQIENVDTGTETLDLKTKKWYNNPYRIKFEKMALNDKNVCAISPIFDYYESGIRYKRGGDLYCNGYIHSDNFELDTTGQTQTSILRKSKYVANGKSSGVYNSSAIYLKDIVMVNGTWILLSDTGVIYSVGSNLKGSLGINNTDESFYTTIPQIVASGTTFKKIYALRDIKGFGALDENNYFWIWGERPNGTIYYKPIILSNSKKFNENSIFINSKDFILKGVDNIYYRTYSDLSIKSLNIDGSALSVSVYDYNSKELLIYVDKYMQLHGSDELLNCRDKDFNSCSTAEKTIFSTALSELNSLTNTINNSLYANFSNVSIFEGKTNKIIVDYGEDVNDNFETGTPISSGWNVNYTHDGESVTGKFLGRLGAGRIDVGSGSQTVYRTFSLGSSWANKNIKISFDMYEIGTWDGKALNGKKDAFYVYINDKLISRDTYTYDNTKDTRVGTDLGILPNSDESPIQKHEYSYSVTLDSTGSVKLGFGATLAEWGIHDGVNKYADYTVESFGINNINISKKIDNTFFSSNVYLEDFEDNNHNFWVVPDPVPDNQSSSEYDNYPIYNGGSSITKYLGKFNRAWGNYYGKSDGSEEVYKVFSFGAENANKQVTIDYDFYRIGQWRKTNDYTTDYFYTFVNSIKVSSYRNTDNGSTSSSSFKKLTFSRTEYLDGYGNIRLGFGAYIKDNSISQTSWGIDNVKFTLTGNTNNSGGGSSSSTQEVKVPTICAMTGIGSQSQMYCWGNVGRSIPILSTSLYDVSKINTINKLFISQENDKTSQMAFDNFDNNGNLFLKYPTYIGGFDYAFYFK